MAGTQKDHHVTDSKNHTKTVQVTSVTPGIKTQKVPAKQQERTRKLVGEALAATAAGKVVKAVAEGSKIVKAVETAKKYHKADEVPMAVPNKIVTRTPSGNKRSFDVKPAGKGKMNLTESKDKTNFDISYGDINHHKIMNQYVQKKINS